MKFLKFYILVLIFFSNKCEENSQKILENSKNEIAQKSNVVFSNQEMTKLSEFDVNQSIEKLENTKFDSQKVSKIQEVNKNENNERLLNQNSQIPTKNDIKSMQGINKITKKQATKKLTGKNESNKVTQNIKKATKFFIVPSKSSKNSKSKLNKIITTGKKLKKSLKKKSKKLQIQKTQNNEKSQIKLNQKKRRLSKKTKFSKNNTKRSLAKEDYPKYDPKKMTLRKLCKLIKNTDPNFYNQMKNMNDEQKVRFLQANSGFFETSANLLLGLGGTVGVSMILGRIFQIVQLANLKRHLSNKMADLVGSRMLTRRAMLDLENRIIGLEHNLENLTQSTESSVYELGAWTESQIF